MNHLFMFRKKFHIGVKLFQSIVMRIHHRCCSLCWHLMRCHSFVVFFLFEIKIFLNTIFLNLFKYHSQYHYVMLTLDNHYKSLKALYPFTVSALFTPLTTASSTTRAARVPTKFTGTTSSCISSVDTTNIVSPS